MSKEFYKYLAHRTIDYFRAAVIRSGEKFILKLNNESEVREYYDAVNELLNGEYKEIYREYVALNDDEYRTSGFSTESSVNIFIVPELYITNAYMTRLRNTVQNNWGMLIVCHSPIDSIAGGTESLQKEGMPFHRDTLIADIREKITASNLGAGIQGLLKFDLNSKKNGGYLDSYSISDHAEIIRVLENKTISDCGFRDFQIFKDDDVFAPSPVISDERGVEERIRDNNRLYKKISDIVRFGDVDRDLSKDFTSGFVKRVKDNMAKYERWDEGITYTDVVNAKNKKDNSEKPLKIEKITITDGNVTLSENSDYYVKAESEKGAKANRKHILIFNSNNSTNFNIEIAFSDTIKANQIKAADSKMNMTASASGKKLTVNCTHSGVTINRIDLKCTERSDRFQFSICVINCSSAWFKSVAPSYKIDAKPKKKRPKSLVIICDSDEILFNPGAVNGGTDSLAGGIEITYDINRFSKLLINEGSFDDENIAYGKLKIGSDVLDMLFMEEAPVNAPCSGIRIEQKKLAAKQSFIYRGDNKLLFGTNEYSTQKDLKLNLELEDYIIKNKLLSCECRGKGSIIEVPLDVDDSIRNAYLALAEYFVSNETLPSLAYYGDELLCLASDYVREVFDALSGFEDKKPLSRRQQDVLRLGVVEYPEERRIAYSPLHPLNVAYRIMLTKEAADMKDEIREDILKKLCPDNLMPMIHNKHGELCKIFDQKESPQWTYYYPANTSKLHGSGDFVSTVVKEKIQEFYTHFSYLFGEVGSNKIIINAVNMGDCHNMFKGIVNYYKERLIKETAPDEMLMIIVNVYNDDKVYNLFDCLGHKPSLKRFLNDEMGIKEDDSRLSENELINCLVSNIRYYRKSRNDDVYEYCHLSFIEMDQKTIEGNSNNRDIRSGAMLDGLISGTSSTYYGDKSSYRTGYGSKFNLNEDSAESILALADRYNSAAMFVFGGNNQYITDNVLCTEIGGEETEMIEKTYDASNWVVFIEPKVDLNFFKSADKDIMIIHYSDQHTTSSGYDSITVTKKTKQYADILREFLAGNNITAGGSENIRGMIDMFNAVNGRWLLKLISANSNFQKEKISIQSAIKLALAFFKNDNITWIPISLEEILRVSGAVGLSQNQGLFTAKQLGYEHGATSDDLLLFGVENRNENIYVHIYPLEVKIGYKNADEITKATEQVRKTKKIFDDNLKNNCGENSLQTKFYRNFIAQLAVISAEKLELYKVWGSQDWEKVFNTEIRGKLLNDRFTISNDLKDVIGDGVVITFKEGTFMHNVTKGEVTVIQFRQEDAVNYLTKSVDEINKTITNMRDISGKLFAQVYVPVETPNTEPAPQSAASAPAVTELNPPSAAPASSVTAANPPSAAPASSVTAANPASTAPASTVTAANPTSMASNSNSGMKILFGHDANNGKPLYWYPNDTEKVLHPNTGIIGTMGTGKTQFTKSLILQLVREQNNNPGNEPLGILIFDYKGDYNKNKQDFVNAVNANVYELCNLPFNPFYLTVSPNCRQMLPMHAAGTFKSTLSKVYKLGPVQEMLLRDAIMQAYAQKGIDKSDRNTWTKPAPVLRDVFNAFKAGNPSKGDSLYSALSELDEFEIFETDPNKTLPLYDFIKGVTVINLQGYNSSIQNLVVAITLDQLYSQMQANGHSIIEGNLRQIKKIVLVDEADNFLKLGFSSIKSILKEGREYGVGTVFSTQFLKHFNTQNDDYSKYILSWIVHKVDDLSAKDIKNLFNPDSKSLEEELLTSIKKLAKHHSFVKLGDSDKPYYIIDRAFWEMV